MAPRAPPFSLLGRVGNLEPLHPLAAACEELRLTPNPLHSDADRQIPLQFRCWAV
jgi:hypothetical protein